MVGGAAAPWPAEAAAGGEAVEDRGESSPVGGPDPGPEFGEVKLDFRQAAVFRSWFVRIVAEVLRGGPSPRWVDRDCASLVRFAVNETLRPHDAGWRRASGLSPAPTPPELVLTPAQRRLRNRWRSPEGGVASYVTALGLVQENTVFVGREPLHALPGDLLFFDQGDDQHLMIWTGDGVAYHRGVSTPKDHGLRAVSLEKLLNWKDSRWQPKSENSNFLGVYRFYFLPS
ncbi:MAG: DUF1175 family protein [Magnetococcales bacterium]|nr:DUF1175 family protein [Magnetococcales bacterium]